MARIEYFDDPDVPEPNSMVVAASAVVTDDKGRILLQKRSDSGLWALPGGGMEMTDSLPGTAVREVKEETGLDVEITGLVGTYTDPGTSSRTATERYADSSTCASGPAWWAGPWPSRMSPWNSAGWTLELSAPWTCTTRNG